MTPMLPKFDPWDTEDAQLAGAAESGAFLIPATPAWTAMADAVTRFFDLGAEEKHRSVSHQGSLGHRPMGVENLAVDAGVSSRRYSNSGAEV